MNHEEFRKWLYEGATDPDQRDEICDIAVEYVNDTFEDGRFADIYDLLSNLDLELIHRQAIVCLIMYCGGCIVSLKYSEPPEIVEEWFEKLAKAHIEFRKECNKIFPKVADNLRWRDIDG